MRTDWTIHPRGQLDRRNPFVCLAESKGVAMPDLERNKQNVVDRIFRRDDEGKIVEHWDVLQIVSNQAANENGMF
jgi:predicted SnoaL-like aldol condensation-catalyzing enzyme